MTARERVNEYAKTVYQLFWQEGLTDVMKMLVTTLDFIYLRRKADTDPYAFNGDDTCLWGNLCIYGKRAFEEIYTDRLDSFFIEQKKYDFGCLTTIAPSLETRIHEFSGAYELFHLTDNLFKDINQANVTKQNETQYGLIFEELVGSWGILKQTKNSLSKHIAKLLSLLVDVRVNDSIYIPNGGIGELPLSTLMQVQVDAFPNQKMAEDIDGFAILDNSDDIQSLDKLNPKLLTIDEKDVGIFMCDESLFEWC